MKKILVVCGSGLGTSFMVELSIKKILKELGLTAEVAHTDLTTSKSEAADLYLGSKEIVDNLIDGKRNVVGLKNLMDKKELTAILQANLQG
ncbi:MAG: PTS sugar transporter subunit IIB [Burkholderiales bacterium]|jgi:PTS system ascorbate-specific IIB component|nr:PTS sugar transporter subunit IIB [Burkholderiales bacterium]MBP9768813.1 PTS sugar transporter subunit IIB [Burkholderiales bacterium]